MSVLSTSSKAKSANQFFPQSQTLHKHIGRYWPTSPFRRAGNFRVMYLPRSFARRSGLRLSPMNRKARRPRARVDRCIGKIIGHRTGCRWMRFFEATCRCSWFAALATVLVLSTFSPITFRTRIDGLRSVRSEGFRQYLCDLLFSQLDPVSVDCLWLNCKMCWTREGNNIQDNLPALLSRR